MDTPENTPIELTTMENWKLEKESNLIIEEYRRSLNYMNHKNRIDRDDLRCVILALQKIGFTIQRKKD